MRKEQLVPIIFFALWLLLIVYLMNRTEPTSIDLLEEYQVEQYCGAGGGGC